jgi:hypothetical protein
VRYHSLPCCSPQRTIQKGSLYGATRCCGEHDQRVARDGRTQRTDQDVHDMRCARWDNRVCSCCCWLPAAEDWPKFSYANYDLCPHLHHCQNPPTAVFRLSVLPNSRGQPIISRKPPRRYERQSGRIDGQRQSVRRIWRSQFPLAQAPHTQKPSCDLQFIPFPAAEISFHPILSLGSFIGLLEKEKSVFCV